MMFLHATRRNYCLWLMTIIGSTADGLGKLDYIKYSGSRGVTDAIKHVADDAREESG